MAFVLDKTLESDSFFVKELQLSQLRLINNQDFLWVILVPKVSGVVEMIDLSDAEYNLLNHEIKTVSKALKNEYADSKLNIAALGNVVSQLHVHIIVRFRDDKLFPAPVWGSEFINYSDEKREQIIGKLRDIRFA